MPARRSGSSAACGPSLAWRTGGYKRFSTSRRMVSGPACDLMCCLLLFPNLNPAVSYVLRTDVFQGSMAKKHLCRRLVQQACLP